MCMICVVSSPSRSPLSCLEKKKQFGLKKEKEKKSWWRLFFNVLKTQRVIYNIPGWSGGTTEDIAYPLLGSSIF